MFVYLFNWMIYVLATEISAFGEDSFQVKNKLLLFDMCINTTNLFTVQWSSGRSFQNRVKAFTFS